MFFIPVPFATLALWPDAHLFLTLVDCATFMFFSCIVGLARDVVGRVSWMFCLSCIVEVVAMLAWKVLELTEVCIFCSGLTFITFSCPFDVEFM